MLLTAGSWQSVGWCVSISDNCASKDLTVLYFLLQGAVKEVTPTVGFNVEQFSRSSINFTVFDMSGAGKYRNLWEHYYKDAQAIIFVIDCSDKLRMCVVKEELQAMLQHQDTKGVPTLFFANKIDISDHLNPVECVQYLDLDSVKDRPWHITPSNALSGKKTPG
jgi:ADP-ribosylation factor-like protein 6